MTWTRNRCSRALVLAGLVASTLVGCGPAPTAGDAGEGHDATPADGGAPASVAVRLSADLRDLPEGVVLDRLIVGVTSVRAPNDRGELARDFDRAADLATEPAELMLEGAQPAVYGSTEVDLGAGAWGHALELVFVDHGQRIEVTIDRDVRLAPRCPRPIALAAGGRLVLDVRLSVRELHEALPPATGGPMRLDEANSPATIAALIEELGERSNVECGELEHP